MKSSSLVKLTFQRDQDKKIDEIVEAPTREIWNYSQLH